MSGRAFVRYRFAERAMHATIGVVFLYVLLTGLALWTPGLYWLASILGGGFLARMLHPWAGVLLFFVVAWMFVLWQDSMRTMAADRAWKRAMKYYIRNEDEKVPPAGRFNYGQKVFFWVMVWGTIALLGSGLALWFPDAIPQNVAIIRQLAVLVHAIAALVVIAAFIVHVYMGVFVVPGSVEAIVHGTVPAEWARHHHRAWAEEIERSR